MVKDISTTCDIKPDGTLHSVFYAVANKKPHKWEPCCCGLTALLSHQLIRAKRCAYMLFTVVLSILHGLSMRLQHFSSVPYSSMVNWLIDVELATDQIVKTSVLLEK